MNVILTTIIVTIIIVISGAIISTNVIGNISTAGNYYTFSNAKNAMMSLQQGLQSLALEINGSRHFTYTDTNGYFTASEREVKFLYDKPAYEDSLTKKDGNIFIYSGPPSTAYTADINNDGNDELILENNAMIFAITRVGNASVAMEKLNKLSSWSVNKQMNITTIPALKISVDSIDILSAKSMGYDEIMYHPAAVSNTIHLFSNSTILNNAGMAGVDVYFMLSGGNDFVEIKVVPRE